MMHELLVKYNALSPEGQQEVNDFLDFMLSKYKDKKTFDMKGWKEKIKEVSVWSEEGIKAFEENRKNDYDTIEKLIYEDGLKIKALHFHPDLDLMLIVLSNKKVLNRAMSSTPRLKQATPEQLNNYRLIGKGAGVHWPDVDEDLSLKGFLKEEIDRSIRDIKNTLLA